MIAVAQNGGLKRDAHLGQGAQQKIHAFAANHLADKQYQIALIEGTDGTDGVPVS